MDNLIIYSEIHFYQTKIKLNSFQRKIKHFLWINWFSFCCFFHLCRTNSSVKLKLVVGGTAGHRSSSAGLGPVPRRTVVRLPCLVPTEASTPSLSSLSAPSASHRTLLQAGLPSVSAGRTKTLDSIQHCLFEKEMLECEASRHKGLTTTSDWEVEMDPVCFMSTCGRTRFLPEEIWEDKI